MQSSKISDGESAIKQLIRQYSTTFKNEPGSAVWTKNMSRSSNLPFDKMYQAFNSNDKFNKLGLAEKFKHSQANSIIEKLMQTQDVHGDGFVDEEAFIFNQLNNLRLDPESSGLKLTLGETETKIFREIVNLLSEIEQINTEFATQNQDLGHIKVEMQQAGLQLPPELPQNNHLAQFRQLSSQLMNSEQVNAMFDENERLQAQIENLTKHFTNSRGGASSQSPRKVMKSLLKKNKRLSQELASTRQELFNTGCFEEQDINELEQQVGHLQRQVQVMEQARFARLSDNDHELINLKADNERIRQKTRLILLQKKSGFLTGASAPVYSGVNQRKQELINFLEREQENKEQFKQEICKLKQQYIDLKEENTRLQNSRQHRQTGYGGTLASGYLDSRLYGSPSQGLGQGDYSRAHMQIQSKVRPINSVELNRSSFQFNRAGKENSNGYTQNYERDLKGNDNSAHHKQSVYLQESYRAQGSGSKDNAYRDNTYTQEFARSQSFGKLNEYEETIRKMRIALK